MQLPLAAGSTDSTSDCNLAASSAFEGRQEEVGPAPHIWLAWVQVAPHQQQSQQQQYQQHLQKLTLSRLSQQQMQQLHALPVEQRAMQFGRYMRETQLQLQRHQMQQQQQQQQVDCKAVASLTLFTWLAAQFACMCVFACNAW